MRTAWAPVLLAIALSGTLTASPQEHGFWSFLEDRRAIPPCVARTAVAKADWDRLGELNARVATLADTDTVAPIVEQLHALLKLPCFLPAAETDRVPTPDSAASLKEWWEHGGHDWLASHVPPYFPRAKPLDEIVVPADARRSLYLTAETAYPFDTLLCAAGDHACGAATRGWVARAEVAFAAHALFRDPRWGFNFGDAQPEAVSERCANRAGKAPGRERYQEWRDCVEEWRPRRTTLPIGAFRSPESGWLIVSGRRGRAEFCDVTAAYDLATGAAARFDSCAYLIRLTGGRVDHAATDRRRSEQVKTGTLPLSNLREAAWMLLMRGTAEWRQVEPAVYPLPSGMKRQTVWRQFRSMPSDPGAANNGQSILTWALVAPGRPDVIGKFTWPVSYEGADDHAASLLRVAEDGLIEGCLAARPPAMEIEIGPPVLLNPMIPPDRQKFVDAYRAAAAKWEGVRACP